MRKKSGHQKPINVPPLDTVLSVTLKIRLVKNRFPLFGFYEVAAKYVRTSHIPFQPWTCFKSEAFAMTCIDVIISERGVLRDVTLNVF